MKRQSIFYTLLFCMMAMVVSFASCSDDDDNDNSIFVGSWVDSEDSDDLFVFNSDGSWTNYFKESGKVYIDKGTYQYNASSKQLRLTFTYSNSPEIDEDDLPWTEVYNVVSVSDNTITLVDPEDPDGADDPIVLVRTSKTSL